MSEFDTRDIVERLIQAGAQLRTLSVGDRAGELSRVAEAWLDVDYEPRREAERMTVLVHGFSAPVVAEGFDRLFGMFARVALERWMSRHPKPRSSPQLTAVLPADNIPGVGVHPAMVSLLAGVPVLVRRTGDDPLLPFLSQSFRDLSPALSEAFHVMRWNRGDAEEERQALSRADLILVFGSDATVRLFDERYPGRVRGYGSSLSLAFVAHDQINDPLAARALAVDVAIWDQHGCLSPQAVYVEGSFEDAICFAELLAIEMERIQSEFPARVPSIDESAFLRIFRADLEARMAAGENQRTWLSGRGLDWTVVAYPDPQLRTGTDRTIPLLPVSRLAEAKQILAHKRHDLQAAGLAAGNSRREELTRLLHDMGFGFVTELGRMQHPPIDWPNKGRDLLQDILEGNSPAARNSET
jgi:hypothetical protein